GGERLDDLQKIYEDNQRTAKIRMRQETSGALQITGSTGYLNMCPGFQFDLARHYSDDDAYVITAASVAIPQRGDYAGDSDEFSGPPPEIVFNCIPVQLPYVPQRVTAKPSIFGTQTAVVVGPDGEEIFTDKYGRVKVQFLWDREGKFNGNSSCWVRVASPWAGKQWGMVHIPRIGQEVVVAFEEGDPDQPIIVGSVYNADQMPPYELPANKTQSGTKSRSTPNAGPNNLNEIRFEDKIGHEHIFIHSEKDTHFRCKGAYLADIGGSFDETIHGDSRVERKGKSSLRVGGDSSHIVHGNRTDFCDQDAIYKAKGTLGLKGDHFRLEGRIGHIGATDDILIDVGSTLAVSASDGIHLKCGNSVLSLTPSGIYISSAKVYINSGSAVAAFTVASKPAIVQADAPRGPMKAGETLATVNPAGGMDSEGNRHNPNDDENKDKTHWVEVELLDESGAPVEGESCEITLPNGKKTTASTNAKGVIRVEKIDPGDCTFRWINLDRDAVNKK
ncbi:MAG TPA: type VI secretion system tip protein TssI/VgrG, partial [Bryobacteraceae bacterium]|nr:type VI secretion system tip protein TssI/VgrG [Bryobacteraceae bacterium]